MLQRFYLHSCAGKKKYDLLWAANIASIIREQHPENQIHPYLCLFCGFYHVGNYNEYTKTRAAIICEWLYKTGFNWEDRTDVSSENLRGTVESGTGKDDSGCSG